MVTVYQRITVIKSGRPNKKSLNEQLQWFGVSLGLFSLRDKDKSRFRIFIELLKAAKTDKALSSDELARQLGITRGTVVHHLKKLIQAGIVSEEKKRYKLRVHGLGELVTEIQRDIQRTCEDLKTVAKDIDSWLNL
jgi:predicted transcriptional regulator